MHNLSRGADSPHLRFAGRENRFVMLSGVKHLLCAIHVEEDPRYRSG
jgi:hypothetical protein